MVLVASQALSLPAGVRLVHFGCFEEAQERLDEALEKIKDLRQLCRAAGDPCQGGLFAQLFAQLLATCQARLAVEHLAADEACYDMLGCC